MDYNRVANDTYIVPNGFPSIFHPDQRDELQGGDDPVHTLRRKFPPRRHPPRPSAQLQAESSAELLVWH